MIKEYYTVDPWRIIEEEFDPSMQEASESIFSLGNGRMGQRANFEETYSGTTLPGNYIAGIYYPDKTRVGWWKNGYPDFFAKVLNAPNWIGIGVKIDGIELDLNKMQISAFRRELNMKHGYLKRNFSVKIDAEKEIEVQSIRFLSVVDDEIGVIRYSVKPLNFNAEISLMPSIDGNVKNRDSNFDEFFWKLLETGCKDDQTYLVSETRKSEFRVAFTMKCDFYIDEEILDMQAQIIDQQGFIGIKTSYEIPSGKSFIIYKYVSLVSSLNYEKDVLKSAGKSVLEKAYKKKFAQLFFEHRKKWEETWSHSDIIIGGDEKAQQAIRFTIFHLKQTYSGKDERLNIGPKGFTGEKYGGSTYWDTEAFLLPFFLSSSPPQITRNLLIYRYRHLQSAIENAALLGFKKGAALYPMVTMDGTECHNEWEITFEEIHRNGAIAYAIFNYVRYTGDRAYLAEYGLEVLIALSRFWKQRVNWSEEKNKYVILGVTGPNEYENNVNNNWYTNLCAKWTLSYTMEVLQYVKENDPDKFAYIITRTKFNFNSETGEWKDIVNNIYFPYSEKKKIFLQQEGYLDKTQMTAAEIDPSERPINQHWSWDRILRSPFIKQADVLQGIYFFEDDYDLETIRRNFDFYEPRTVHESSLSPCIHSIIASKLGMKELAYDLYLRTSRLDLDDYNNEVAEGLHITSMGGTWMSVVYGFGGMRVKNNLLHLDPKLPVQWDSLSCKIIFRKNNIALYIDKTKLIITNETGPELSLIFRGNKVEIKEKITFELRL